MKKFFKSEFWVVLVFSLSLCILAQGALSATPEEREATFTTYPLHRQHLPAQQKMFDAQDEYFSVTPEVDYPEDPLMTLAITQHYLQERFVFTSDDDEIGDHWESLYDEFLAGRFEGDCDNYVFTAAVALVKAGFRRGDLFIASVKTWRRYNIDNRTRDASHPRNDYANHVVLFVFVRGHWAQRGGDQIWIEQHWRIIDNNTQGIPYMAELVGEGRDYRPVAIANSANLTISNEEHVRLHGWVRFWVYL